MTSNFYKIIQPSWVLQEWRGSQMEAFSRESSQLLFHTQSNWRYNDGKFCQQWVDQNRPYYAHIANCFSLLRMYVQQSFRAYTFFFAPDWLQSITWLRITRSSGPTEDSGKEFCAKEIGLHFYLFRDRLLKGFFFLILPARDVGFSFNFDKIIL